MLEKELNQFYGSDYVYRLTNLLPTRITEGVKYFIEKGNAHWAIIDIALYAKELKQPFLVAELKSENEKAILVLDDGNDNVLKTRKYSYTDLESGKYKFYVIDDIILLPSEY